MRRGRLAAWLGVGTVLVVAAWSVLQPTTVSTLGLARVMADPLAAHRPAPALYSIDGDGPPLGEPHDWFVVATNGSELARIDLADGDVDGYRLEGYPQVVASGGAAGPDLVLAGPAPQPVYSVSIHDPAGDRRNLFRWPIDARDPVNAAYFAVERVDDETVRVDYVRQEGFDLVRAAVDIDLTSGRRRYVSNEAKGPGRWLQRWIGRPTAATDGGGIIAGPASEKGKRAVLVRSRTGESFHNPVSIPLRFRPDAVTLVPKTVSEPDTNRGEAAAGTAPPTTTPPPITAVPPAGTWTFPPKPPVPLEVLRELDEVGYEYLIAGNHRSFHRVRLATGDVDRFDLGVRVVAVTSGDDGERELVAIEPGSAVVAVSAEEPTGVKRRLLSLRHRQGGIDRPTTVRVVSGPGLGTPVIEYWDLAGTTGGWQPLDLDLARPTGPVGGYRLEPSGRGVVFVADDGDRRYFLPLEIAGGVSSVLLT